MGFFLKAIPLRAVLIAAGVFGGAGLVMSTSIDNIVSITTAIQTAMIILSQPPPQERIASSFTQPQIKTPRPEISSYQADLLHKNLQNLLASMQKLNCAIQTFPSCQSVVGLTPQTPPLVYPDGGRVEEIYTADSSVYRNGYEAYNQQLKAMKLNEVCTAALALASSAASCGADPTAGNTSLYSCSDPSRPMGAPCIDALANQSGVATMGD